MAIDVDINASPDLNEYDPEDYKELSSSVIGEGVRETSLNMGVIIAIIVFLIALSILYYITHIILKDERR